MKTINRLFQSNREIDENGYLTVHNCFLLHNGVMEYSGTELINGCGIDEIDGVRIDPNKIYKLNITSEELVKAKDTFKLVPIVNEHVFLGKDGKNPKDYQEGSVGENLDIIKEIDEDGVEKEFLVGTLKFTNPETIELINEGKKEELSTSYSNDLQKSENSAYDFEVINIVANHVALVDRGRAGSKVRVANKVIKNVNGRTMKKEKLENLSPVDDIFNEVSLKEAAKVLEEETKHHEEHPVSEESEKKETENESIDKRKVIDEIGGILKGKVDEELWRTVIGKAEKLSYDGSERYKSDNEEEDEDKDAKHNNKSCNEKINLENFKNEMIKNIKTQLENENKNILKAYNEVKVRTGDFNFIGMNESDIYKKAFENTNIDLTGEETIGELKAMYRVYNSLVSKNTDYTDSSEKPQYINVPDCYK